MGTLVGASGMTYFVSSGIQKAFDYNPKWLALAVAQVICIVYVTAIGKVGLLEYFVAICNGFLVYSTAVGANAATSSAPSQAKDVAVSQRSLGEVPAEREPRGWQSPWF